MKLLFVLCLTIIALAQARRVPKVRIYELIQEKDSQDQLDYDDLTGRYDPPKTKGKRGQLLQEEANEYDSDELRENILLKLLNRKKRNEKKAVSVSKKRQSTKGLARELRKLVQYIQQNSENDYEVEPKIYLSSKVERQPDSEYKLQSLKIARVNEEDDDDDDDNNNRLESLLQRIDQQQQEQQEELQQELQDTLQRQLQPN